MNPNVAKVQEAVVTPTTAQAVAAPDVVETVTQSDLSGVAMQPETGFLDKLKDFFNPSTAMERLNLNKDTLLAMVLYLGVGFLIGFIVKKYFKILLIVSLPIILLIIMAKFDMLSVIFNWAKLGTTFGIKPLPALDMNLLYAGFGWVKGHIALTLSGVVGFFVGLRLG